MQTTAIFIAMGSTQNFRWTNQAKDDLFAIVNACNETQKPNWSNIAIQFKQIYSNYSGKDDSLRKQYTRLKTQNAQFTLGCSDDQDEPFRWSDKAEQDLCLIVQRNKNANGQDWSNVLTDFQKQHPQYRGLDLSLQRQYYRIQEKLSSQPFVWNKSNSMDLVRLVNLINVDGYPNWTKIYYTFQRYNPNFVGNKDDIRCHFEYISNDDNAKFVSDPNEHELDWNDNMDVLLAEATGHAQHILNCQKRDRR